ncbi:hypothetical protein PIB30_083504 [Stylosanthes scabra]|uniref:Uncharacterized protein n=1 Tax=Stylosanthes scabra TaxID=79078 RepID=A0ABU6YPW7_9FABA|nr:hypothetical protein [Stylosanthes scabra]
MRQCFRNVRPEGQGMRNRGESPKHGFRRGFERGKQVSGELRIDSLVPDFEFNVQNYLRVDSSSSKSILKVQVQAWKVAKHVVERCGLDSPDVRVFRCVFNGELEYYVYESELSVCSATVSAKRVRGAISHTGVLHATMCPG